MHTWTDERLLEALKLRQRGLTFAEIAQRMDGSPGTLHTKLARRGMITTNNKKSVARRGSRVIERA
jgi:DNA-binding CsgD family transcriptional regulator